MKIQLENIEPAPGSSFRILVSPRLNDFYYWHFHPEYELVFIELESGGGTRHVGEHIERYEGSDLLFIGSNIPHLNLDYGVKSNYIKIVVQMREDFLASAFSTIPELYHIQILFNKSRKGLYFNGETKKVVGERLKRFPDLPQFQQFVEILNIFQILSTAAEVNEMHTQPYMHHYNVKEQERLRRIYQFIENNYEKNIGIEEVAGLSHLTKSAFCRYFKKMTRMTFTEFLNQYRINQAKKLLLLDKNVTEVCFECGFESLSYFNRTFKKVTGENPLRFKRRHAH
ncbi:MAG: AraC family transcriptional regulator [Saprospiraceae bacterium]